MNPNNHHIKTALLSNIYGMSDIHHPEHNLYNMCIM